MNGSTNGPAQNWMWLLLLLLLYLYTQVELPSTLACTDKVSLRRTGSSSYALEGKNNPAVRWKRNPWGSRKQSHIYLGLHGTEMWNSSLSLSVLKLSNMSYRRCTAYLPSLFVRVALWECWNRAIIDQPSLIFPMITAVYSSVVLT